MFFSNLFKNENEIGRNQYLGGKEMKVGEFSTLLQGSNNSKAQV